MPCKLAELEAAGVPIIEGLGDTELTSGSSFGPNLYLDEKEEHHPDASKGRVVNL